MSSCRYPKSFANRLHGIQDSLMFIVSNIPVRLNSKRVTWAFLEVMLATMSYPSFKDTGNPTSDLRFCCIKQGSI